jgi:hypothetical protein
MRAAAPKPAKPAGPKKSTTTPKPGPQKPKKSGKQGG